MMTVGSIIGGTWAFLRANPRAIAAWCGIYLIVAFLARWGMAPFYEAQIAAAQARAAGMPPPLPPIGGFLAMWCAIMIVLAVLYNAVFRAVLFPAERRAFYLRLGMDEVRLIGLIVALGLLWIVATIILAVALIAIGVAVGTIAGGSRAVAGGLIFLFVALVWCALMFVTVRLSVAAPLTLHHRRIVIGAAWRLTRGRFWTLFAAYLLFAIVSIVIGLLFVLPQMATLLPALGQPDPIATQLAIARFQQEQAAMTLTPGGIVWLIGGAIVGGILHAAFAGLSAVATSQLLTLSEPPTAPSRSTGHRWQD